jgi:hypothetical protein
MASENDAGSKWILKMEAILDNSGTPTKKNLTLSTLLKSINNYDLIHDPETRKRARQIILEASKRIIEKNRGTGKKLTYREGTKTRLRQIGSYANQLSKIIEPLLHIDEAEYSRNLIEEFMPKVEEAARFATKLDPEMAAQMLKILDSAEILGLTFNKDLSVAFKEIIELHVVPKNLDASRLLLELAQARFEAGEYLTSYLLSREATRSIVEDLTGAYTKELGPEEAPSPDWRFEDYLRYLMEVGLVPVEEGKEFLELFVGEPEHLNSRWKKRREADRALTGVRNYLDLIDSENAENEEWL